MEFELLTELQRRHPAWRLLCADSAPLVLSFLGEVFEGNARPVSASDLAARLEVMKFITLLRAARPPRLRKPSRSDW